MESIKGVMTEDPKRGNSLRDKVTLLLDQGRFQMSSHGGEDLLLFKCRCQMAVPCIGTSVHTRVLLQPQFVSPFGGT